MSRSLIVTSVAALALSLSVSAQQAVTVGAPPPATDGGPPVAFDVTTVKPNKSGDPFISISMNAGRFTASNFPLRQLIQTTFRLQPNQLVGGPDWLNDRYDITGTVPAGVPPARRDDMIRALLAERFKLATHTETRELPIYALVTVRTDRRLGPQLSVTANDCTAEGRARRGGGGGAGAPPARAGAPPPAAAPPGGLPPPALGMRPPCGTAASPSFISAGGITMARLAELLSGRVGRTVVDRTGLAGLYEFDLSYAPNPGDAGAGGPLPPGVPAPPAIDPNAPSIFTALQEQLGLKLDSTRGPVEVTVIDRIERPAED